MTDETDRISAEAIDVAQIILALASAHSTASVYLGISLVLGAMEAESETPDLSRLMQIVEKTARDELDRRKARHH